MASFVPKSDRVDTDNGDGGMFPASQLSAYPFMFILFIPVALSIVSGDGLYACAECLDGSIYVFISVDR
jgi:hypothetical protein